MWNDGMRPALACLKMVILETDNRRANSTAVSLELFRQSCKKIYVHQITKQDLQKFGTDLMEHGDSDRKH
jgi:hypothetical protein